MNITKFTNAFDACVGHGIPDEVAQELKGASARKLWDIIEHGIRKFTDKYSGKNYAAYQKEFDTQARKLLAAQEQIPF